jgi:hypothetical protein
MTKRTNKPKAPSTVAPQAPTEAVGSVKLKTNTIVAPSAKKATIVAKKATTKPRGRPKKAAVVEKPVPPEGKVVSEVTYVAPSRAILVAEPPPPLYDRFVGWLCRVTYNFRGY